MSNGAGNKKFAPFSVLRYKNNSFGVCSSGMKTIIYSLLASLALSERTVCHAQTNAAFFLDAASSAFNSRNFNNALTNITRAIEINPDFPDAYCERGMIKWWLQDYQGAVADYDKAIALNPKCGGYYCNRGQAKCSLKMIPDALADYDKAIGLDPKNAQAFFNRGTLKIIYLTNYTGAITDLTEAIDLHGDPHEEDLYYFRGAAKHELKDYAGAIAD